MSLFLDSPTNEFNTIYPSWPFRVWIIDEKKQIRFKGMAGTDTGYNVNLFPVRSWIRNYHLNTSSEQAIQNEDKEGMILAQSLISQDMNNNGEHSTINITQQPIESIESLEYNQIIQEIQEITPINPSKSN